MTLPKSPLFPIDASQFIPHKPPMLMVGQIVSVDDQEKSSIIETTVHHDSPFLSEKNTLYGEALIEIMAQAAAAQHGYNLAKDNKKEEKGFIVGIRKFEISGEAAINDKLSVSVKLGPEIESLSVVYGAVICKNKQIASTELTVWHE